MKKSSDEFQRPASKVPSGKLSRFLQLGAAATRMAAGGVAEKAKRVGRRAQEELPHVLLTGQNAKLLAARLSRLRGAAMKVGQMLSLEGDNFLPSEFAAALEVLRSSAHQMPKQQVRDVLARELGEDFLSRVGSFEFEPFAAASIGQVHRATTLEGQSIVLKIQYPGIAESIDSDVDNLKSLLTLARLLPGEIDVNALTAEVKRELHHEVNYERELGQLLLYRESLGERDGLFVPAAHPHLSTDRVLAMGHAPGEELLEWSRSASQEKRDSAGARLVHLLLIELFEMGLVQTDPNPANYLYDAESDRLVLLDFGATREVPPHVRAVYWDAFSSLAGRDRVALGAVLERLGVAPQPGAPAFEKILSLALEASDIFEEGVFDFGETDLAVRLQAHGKELLRFQRDLKSPPAEFIFFQRKLAGTFLLCRQLRARIDVRQIFVEHGILPSL